MSPEFSMIVVYRMITKKILEKESLRLHKKLDRKADNDVRLVIEREIYKVMRNLNMWIK